MLKFAMVNIANKSLWQVLPRNFLRLEILCQDTFSYEQIYMYDQLD